jgi:BTB/POZ domain
LHKHNLHFKDKQLRHNSSPSSSDNTLQSFRLAMVNNATRSDIVFLVGRAEPVKIHAHSPILMMQSEVFASMFSGDFEITSEIAVTDVDPNVFLQLMNFIYAGLPAVTLTTSNMIDLLYGAQKYMLDALKKACEDFILTNTKCSNLLEVYNASQLFENGGKLREEKDTPYWPTLMTVLFLQKSRRCAATQ